MGNYSYKHGDIQKNFCVESYFNNDGVEKVACYVMASSPYYFFQVYRKWSADGGINIFEDDYKVLLKESAEKYYDEVFMKKIKEYQYFCDTKKRFSDEDINRINKEECIPLIMEIMHKSKGSNFNIVKDKSKVVTRQQIKKETDEYYKRYENTAPTLQGGFIILLIVMALTSITYNRLESWILEVIIYLIWRAKEVKKYHSGNPEKDPYYYCRPRKEDFK